MTFISPAQTRMAPTSSLQASAMDTTSGRNVPRSPSDPESSSRENLKLLAH